MLKLRIPAILAVLLLVLVACTDETRGQIADAVGDGTVPEADAGAPEDAGAEGEPAATPEVNIEIEAAAEEPPPEPAAEDQGLSNEALALIALVVGVGIIVLLLASRRSGAPVTQQTTVPAPQPAPPPAPTFAEEARNVYVDARWVSDNASGDLAAWRSDRALGKAGAPGASTYESVSRDLDDRFRRSFDDIYRLEAAASTSGQREASRGLAAALRSVQSAFEASVAARSRSQAAGPQGLEAARSEADARLTEARRGLTAALDRLADTS